MLASPFPGPRGCYIFTRPLSAATKPLGKSVVESYFAPANSMSFKTDPRKSSLRKSARIKRTLPPTLSRLKFALRNMHLQKFPSVKSHPLKSAPSKFAHSASLIVKRAQYKSASRKLARINVQSSKWAPWSTVRSKMASVRSWSKKASYLGGTVSAMTSKTSPCTRSACRRTDKIRNFETVASGHYSWEMSSDIPLFFISFISL